MDPEARRKLEESLQARMESLNMELDPFERVSMIVIVDGPWSIGNGLMTPTLKIRRGALESRYDADDRGVEAGRGSGGLGNSAGVRRCAVRCRHDYRGSGPAARCAAVTNVTRERAPAVSGMTAEVQPRRAA